jgi:hypothetical protein
MMNFAEVTREPLVGQLELLTKVTVIDPVSVLGSKVPVTVDRPVGIEQLSIELSMLVQRLLPFAANAGATEATPKIVLAANTIPIAMPERTFMKSPLLVRELGVPSSKLLF